MSEIVADASVLVALLVDDGPAGRWAASTLAGGSLHAPHLVGFEVVNVLRRLEASSQVSVDAAAQAHRDLLDLPVALWPHEALAARVWELRSNLTAYDAAYVAVAEATGAALVTIDHRLSHAA
ncbi:MAG: type II toxin-antitoxin system VapC family toxin, partial [Actinomycetota bacterium]